MRVDNGIFENKAHFIPFAVTIAIKIATKKFKIRKLYFFRKKSNHTSENIECMHLSLIIINL